MKTNYDKICQELIKQLPDRQKQVVLDRFGLNSTRERKTLEAIGRAYGITRERVRQIGRDAFTKLKPELNRHEIVFAFFKNYLKKSGGIQKESILLEELGGQKYQNEVYFLLSLSQDFERIGESEDLHALWTLGQKEVVAARKTIKAAYEKLKKVEKPVKLNVPVSFLEASKAIGSTVDGLWGLNEWAEINPRGIKDKAYLVMKQENKPLHFTQVAKLIDSALPQTVHNELIKDQRFILVGRGLYALSEWGYQPGHVKDVIANILVKAGKPLSKEQIINYVLKQRFVKANTVTLNLSNRKFFSKVKEGFYTVNHREA